MEAAYLMTHAVTHGSVTRNRPAPWRGVLGLIDNAQCASMHFSRAQREDDFEQVVAAFIRHAR